MLLKEKCRFLIMYHEGGAKRLQVEIKMDPAYPEPKIIVLTAAMTEEVNQIIGKLSEEYPTMLPGIRGDKVELLEIQELIRIYAHSGRVYAVTEKGEYVIRRRLYELEEQLDGECFVRISNSEIINLKKVEYFDLSFAGTIHVKLCDHTSTYVSRRYVAKIKSALGI